MIRAGVGLSTAFDALRAADEAVAGASAGLEGARPDFAVAFFTSELHDRASLVLARLAQRAGTPYVVGCTAASVSAGGLQPPSGSALGVLLVASDAMRATPFLFDGEDLGYTTGLRLGERLVGSRRSEDLVLVWPDPFHVRPDRLLRGIAESLPGVAVVGGAASGGEANGPTWQFRGEDYRGGAVSGLRLSGEFDYRVAVTQGCRPLGPPMRVTGAHENVLLEVEERPAVEVLREVAPPGVLDDLERALDYLFVGLVAGNPRQLTEGSGYSIRNLLAIDPDTGMIGVGSQVDEGQRIVFAVRDGRSARSDLARVTRSLADEADSIDYRFGMYFDCVARGRALYGEDGVDAHLIREAFPDVPVLGFATNAEFAPAGRANRLFTYTGVLLMVGEPR